MWTFGRKLGAGFALAFLLLLAIGAIARWVTGTLTDTSRWVAHTHQVLEHIASTRNHLLEAEVGQRGFVIVGNDVYLEPYNRGSSAVASTIRELRQLTGDNGRQQRRLDELEPLLARHLEKLKANVEARRIGGFDAARTWLATGEDKAAMDQLRGVLDAMEQDERDLLKKRADEVESASTHAAVLIVIATLLALLVVSVAAISITRSVTGQVGNAVRDVHSSSSELQAAATQQVTGSRQQATAMAEITTTMSELLATSRQIASSAQRVAQMAQQATSSARTGDQTSQRTQESVTAIRKQVDVIVAHMLELGKKSQQIGSILDIINELSEQTNILAINATIEAAGAGESGRRFGVVADEIRKLADRVGGSTKDIRRLVDDIRAAVNTTVMATEGGSKAVDAGARQFAEVASSFAQIVNLVSTTTEAAREIELSTKQQSTAVEQVNIAVANVSQAAKETEASSSQTLQTSAQLTTLARELTRIIQPRATA